MAATPLEFSVSGKGEDEPAPTLNKPGLLTATCPTNGITTPSTYDNLSKNLLYASPSPVAKNDGTIVDEVMHRAYPQETYLQ